MISMEGKSLIMSALLVSLVLGQFEVGAAKSCCPNPKARNVFNLCSFTPGGSDSVCASLSGCKIVNGECPNGWNYSFLENTVHEYCKLGCASSVCAAITTLQNSDASEVVNEAVEKCSQACSALCTKASITAA
ncbi:probable thionin-2.4 isoform X2 [Salvia miltiorrhiza]|uniref:probable thionin-2.4 isoform X2 n=1 Tax=Salvia miltiorrhiza TaxID=226208 RepID=UPI0025ACF68E|nr:probable thionin-2.4 isoform X2 [Salvia miltiorrhiza]